MKHAYLSPSASARGARPGATLSPPKGSPVYGEGKISLRVDQPVEGCSMMTHAFFRSGDGDIDDKDVDMEFHWYRSAMRRACANRECTRHTSEGAGNVLLLVAKIECVQCCRLGITREHSCFCSADCFRLAWHSHKQLHDAQPPPLQLDGASLPWKSQLDNMDAFCPLPAESWVQIHEENSRTYTPTAADVGHVIRVECRATKRIGGAVLTKTVDTGIVLPFPPMPPRRQMLANVHEERLTPRLRHVGVFRVLTYNVLSEICATRQMYPYCPVWALSWSFRRELLRRELQSYNADVLCLQEVQADHYKDFFAPMMADWGYEGWYLQKTRESMGLDGKVDGCALFYKRNRFILKERYPVEFNELANDFLAQVQTEYDLDYQGPGMAAREAFRSTLAKMRQRLTRDNVAQIAVLEVVPSTTDAAVARKTQAGPLLCIANVHIFSNPKFPDVKLWQTNMLTKQIERVTLSRNLPIILCGDFNSEPVSAVYEFMTRNHVPLEHPDLQQPPPHLANIYASLDLEHNLGLGSGYASVFGAEPEYTNYTGRWTGVCDYVWYTPEQLTPFAGLKVHPPQVLEAYSKTALPNCQFLSDHVPLCLDFSFKATNMNNGIY